MRTTEQHNFQFDFIKIKTNELNRKSVNMEVLLEHPTIRNAYILKDKSGLYGKNFKLYFNKRNHAILETSIPYLIYGHNYVEITADELKSTIELLENLLNINLKDAEVIQFEYGCFATVDQKAKTYIKSVHKLSGYDLKFNSSYMKMFGYGELNFKIYDAIANAKRKKTYTVGKYPKGNLIKYELKLTDAAKHLKSKFYLRELYDLINVEAQRKSLLSHIEAIANSNITINLDEGSKSLNEIMYMCLVTLQEKFEYSFHNKMMEIIDLLNMTPSQKCKRRKSFMELEKKFKLNQVN